MGSADGGWRVQAAASWKLTLPCTRAEAEALNGDVDALDGIEPPPVLMTSEPDPAEPDRWRLDVYFEGRPDEGTLAVVRSLVPGGTGVAAAPERIEDADWVALSQADLTPIRAGRFFVHTAAHGRNVPNGATGFHIEAGRAFGTGHHETTTGCLTMLDTLRARGHRFANVADIGTGTGLLAFAALSLWPRARVIATDIDPVAIEVAATNAEVNGLPLGRGPGRIELAVAAGLAHHRLRARAPFDLIVANILAGPLIDLAPALAAALAPGGTLLLAGLLDRQADDVAAAYRCRRLRLADRLVLGDWPTLRMVAPRRWRARRGAAD